MKKSSRLLSDLGGGWADDTWEKRLQHYLKPNLLILDDFAMKEFTKTRAEDLYELIDRLVSCAHVITLTGKSCRSLLRPDKDLAKEVATV